MATANFALELVMLNYLPVNHMNVAMVNNRVDCANRCLYYRSCLSMVYNTVSGLCYLYNAEVPSSPTGPTDADLLMYNVNAGGAGCNSTEWPFRVCRTEIGYLYEESLDFCYKLHSETLTYTAAVTTCVDEGSRGLARLDTPAKLDFFMNMISQFTRVDGCRVGGNWVYTTETNLPDHALQTVGARRTKRQR